MEFPKVPSHNYLRIGSFQGHATTIPFATESYASWNRFGLAACIFLRWDTVTVMQNNDAGLKGSTDSDREMIECVKRIRNKKDASGCSIFE